MDKNNSFEFFEDEEEDQKIDLIEIQKAMFTRILNLGNTQDTSDDDELDVEVGDGQRIDKRVLSFKVLVYD